MRKAILTAGPQGAGKTMFCKEVVRHRPEIILIERDAILMELFGPRLDPYSGGHIIGEDAMWERVKMMLAGSADITMILDAWYGYPDGRSGAAKRLRSFGADCVNMWYFVTPEEVCLRQYGARELADKEDWLRRANLECCRRNFRAYHSMPIEDASFRGSCFDIIKMINPRQMTFIPYADLLL